MQPCSQDRGAPARRPSDLSEPLIRRELCITALGLAVTLAGAALAVDDIVGVLVNRISDHRWAMSLGQGLFLLIVLFLIYGACVYHLARLGHLRRLRAHVPASDEQLRTIYASPASPLVTALVPSYMEEIRVVRRTLLSIALQEYPHRRAVLLIDNPPLPANDADARLLEATRSLPAVIGSLLEEPKKQCAAALDAFRACAATARLDPAQELRRLAALHADLADWFTEQAERYAITDHGDRLFVELTLRGPGRNFRAEAERLTAAAQDAGAMSAVDVPTLAGSYARLLGRFDTEVVSFERKRYENLSHAASKAMNLNSYIALIGHRFCERERGGRLFLDPCLGRAADLAVPASEFVMIVDADSVVTPDYALRLIHLTRLPGNERVAVAQTPYQAFPDAPGAVEQIAGATTDIQYLIHQGFTHYDATYWVGANAVVRTAALADIATHSSERGHTVTRFIRDDTVIEDTESTVDLLARGWQLHNYPESLAYSETPPDFGSLLIQRRRWANGGLLILPALLRHLANGLPGRARVLQGLMMVHYLTSLAAVNVGLLVVLGFSFENSMRTFWLPLTALPYYLLYARDLRMIGRRSLDVCRVYALNLVLLPVHLAGVLDSLRQAFSGRKTAFGRTPKILGRTKVPAVYVLAELGLLAHWVGGALRDFLAHAPVHALLTITNIAFLAYGCATFIGIRESIEDVGGALGGRKR